MEVLWWVMKSDAAASAASMRVGGMSVEHIEPDTSIVSSTVVWFVGTAATATGRASATARNATAASTSTNGRCRRRDVRGIASRTSERLE